MAPSAARWQKELSPSEVFFQNTTVRHHDGATQIWRALLWYTGAEREAVGAPPSRSQNCCPDPSNKTSDGVEFLEVFVDFLLFSIFHEFRIFTSLPLPSQHKQQNVPSTFPLQIANPQVMAPLLVQGPHHIAGLGWGGSTL